MGHKEFCRRPNAFRRFTRNRRGERKASSWVCSGYKPSVGISSAGAQEISVFPIKELLPPVTLAALNEMFSTATREDIERRRAEQVARFLGHWRDGTLTSQWKRFGEKHVSEEIVFQRRTKATGLRNR